MLSHILITVMPSVHATALVSFPDPTAVRIQYRARGGGSGDFYHVFVFEWNVQLYYLTCE